MNFNSAEFMFFLPLVLFASAFVPQCGKRRDLLLLFSSYAFYMAWRWEYSILILLSTVVDFIIGQSLGRTNDKKCRNLLLVTSLSLNLGLLFYFKYWNFFISTTSHISTSVQGWHHNWMLPVGISFYTFQTMSYTIDVYRRQIPPEKSLLKFAVFVTFFPQLVAGPIVRAKEFLPQLNRQVFIERNQFNSGLVLIFIGLFKKIVLADLLASLAVDSVFSNPENFSSTELLLALYGYAFQIYNDFSGYSDIAIGTASLFGFVLPTNFRSPYLARNLREFWSRWHISLSTWIRDYLYIPLGGNRKGSIQTTFNLCFTMLLAGFWHGASWNFGLWGLYHGSLLIFLTLLMRLKLPKFPYLMSCFLSFHLVCFGWLLFRISNLESLSKFITGLLQFSNEMHLSSMYLCILLSSFLFHLVPEKLVFQVRDAGAKLPSPALGLVFSTLIVLYCACSLQSPTFIYFQF